MQEIVLILSSLAGVATAAAIRKMPRDKNQLLSLGASSHIKSQVSSLKIEKDILTKTISRLYQTDSEFSKIQKDKLLLKYQHQLGIVLAKLEKLEQASNHPDLGPVGDGLITLMDQKLSKLDDRLYELSSKMVTSTKVETPRIEEPEIKKQESKSSPKSVFNFVKPKDVKVEPVTVPPTKSGQSFELTTLTNIPRKEPKFPLFGTKAKPMPEPKMIQTELIKPKEEIIKEITTQPKPIYGPKPDINKKVAEITKYKALPEPKILEPTIVLDDDFGDDNEDDLDKIKRDITRVLSKLDQAEVE